MGEMSEFYADSQDIGMVMQDFYNDEDFHDDSINREDSRRADWVSPYDHDFESENDVYNDQYSHPEDYCCDYTGFDMLGDW